MLPFRLHCKLINNSLAANIKGEKWFFTVLEGYALFEQGRQSIDKAVGVNGTIAPLPLSLLQGLDITIGIQVLQPLVQSGMRLW